MYKTKKIVPYISLTEFTYSFHWYGGMLSQQIHKIDLFNFYYTASTPNQDEEYQHFGPPGDFCDIFFS